MNRNTINKKSVKKGLVPYLFMFLIMLGIFYVVNIMNTKVNTLTYNEFMTELTDGTIKNASITTRESAGTYEVTGKLKGYMKKLQILIDLQIVFLKVIFQKKEKKVFK